MFRLSVEYKILVKIPNFVNAASRIDSILKNRVNDEMSKDQVNLTIFAAS
jgi:hypothetical protein